MAQPIRSGEVLEAKTERAVDAEVQRAADAETQRRRESAAKVMPVSGESVGKAAYGNL